MLPRKEEEAKKLADAVAKEDLDRIEFGQDSVVDGQRQPKDNLRDPAPRQNQKGFSVTRLPKLNLGLHSSRLTKGKEKLGPVKRNAELGPKEDRKANRGLTKPGREDGMGGGKKGQRARENGEGIQARKKDTPGPKSKLGLK
ncbi:unnamed protein product [Linum trigynum]